MSPHKPHKKTALPEEYGLCQLCYFRLLLAALALFTVLEPFGFWGGSCRVIAVPFPYPWSEKKPGSCTGAAGFAFFFSTIVLTPFR